MPILKQRCFRNLLFLCVMFFVLPATVQAENSFRVATYNLYFVGESSGQIAATLSEELDPEHQAVLRVIAMIQPDILLVNELDYDSEGAALSALRTALAAQSLHEQGVTLHYPYAYQDAVNTGVQTGFDLNQDGQINAADAQGWGNFKGQYGMAVLSKFPILESQIRQFQNFLWYEMPNALIPIEYYPHDAVTSLRLASKSIWDIPILLPDQRVVHLLASHPTPPVFDGVEDRNGRRNHDEIRFLVDYLDNADYIVDDNGYFGGLAETELFVVAGDLNNDPVDGEGRKAAMMQLLTHERIQDALPQSLGGAEASLLQQGENRKHRGNPALDTADWRDYGRYAAGNLRVDYVLPSIGLIIKNSAVFWPETTDPVLEEFTNLGRSGRLGSDHHLVYVDLLLNKE